MHSNHGYGTIIPGSIGYIFHGTAHISEIGAFQVPWNSMELLLSAKLAHSKFHGIPWNCSYLRNWRTPNSMEIHGTARVIEIGALQVPWNSIEFNVTARVSEIGALQVPWNSMEFHGTARVCEIGSPKVPWNLWNSMEFHGTARVIEIGPIEVPWNSIKFHGTARVSEIGALLVPWNSMELLVSAIMAPTKFHWIPWIDFHGTARSSEIGALQVPLNSMEFHGAAPVIKIDAPHVPYNSMEFNWSVRVSEIAALQDPWNSMELFMSSKLAHPKFHVISWNCSCHDIGALQVPWNSMKCHGTARVSLIGTLQFPKFVLNLERIPWNLSFQILMRIIFNFSGWINLRKLMSTLYLFLSFLKQCMFNFQCLPYNQLHFRHNSLRIKISFQISFQCSLKLILIKKVPMKFHQSSMELSQ